MAAKSKLLQRAWAIWLLAALFVLAIPPSGEVNAQAPVPRVYEFPTHFYGGTYGDKYQVNELRMLYQISSNGSLPIANAATIDCVSLLGDLDNVETALVTPGQTLDSNSYYELANYKGNLTKGAGACDVCSWLYYFLSQEGFVETPGHTHTEHKKIPGVPEAYSISIWSSDPAQNIWMTNTTGADKGLRWEITENNTVKFWVESAGTQNSAPPEQQVVTYQKTAFENLSFMVDQRSEVDAFFSKDLSECHDMSKPDMIVIHEALIESLGTQSVSYAESLDGSWYGQAFSTRLNDPKNPAAGTWNRVGYHFIVSYRQDQGLKYVPTYWSLNTDCMSWGVGPDINSHAIQIGIVGYPPHQAGNPQIFPNQYLTVLALVRSLMDQYGIPASKVVGHVEVGTHDDPEAINLDQFRLDVVALEPETAVFRLSPKTVTTAKNVGLGTIVIGLIFIVGLIVLRIASPNGYAMTMKTMGMAAKVAWYVVLLADELLLGLTNRQRQNQIRAMRYGCFAGLSMTCCVIVIAMIPALNDRGVTPGMVYAKAADLSPMLDNYLEYALGELPIALTPGTPSSQGLPNNPLSNVLPANTGGVTYVGVYGALNGWGTLGEATNALEAIQKALAYAQAAESWTTGKIVPVVNIRVTSEAVMESLIGLCRDRCVVMIDITPNQDVSGLIQKYAPMGENVWIDIDLEHRGVKTAASEFNSWAQQYFAIRQQNGFTSLGVFGFYDFRSDPWLTPPSEVVWSYNGGQGLVVPIFDGHCSGAPCMESKFGATRAVLSNYAQAKATGIMEFSTRWGCGSQYGDCGFTNQQYFEEFHPLIFMSQ